MSRGDTTKVERENAAGASTEARGPVNGVIEPLKTDDRKYLLHKPVYLGEK